MKETEDKRNRVLNAGYRPSENFYASDLLLRSLLREELSAEAMRYMSGKLDEQGLASAGKMNALAADADKCGPQLVKRNALGETLNEIKFHPAYAELLKISLRSEMIRVKWEPELRARFQNERHRMGFSTGYLFAMSESGQYCPLCMTDGVARLIDLFCTKEDKARLLPAIYTNKPDDFFTGAMFLTEKTGGSDVGANLVEAKPLGNGLYSLHGEKWFCSNANAELIFVLARTAGAPAGTKGLSIFLVERKGADGTVNPIEIIRLKDKLGVRSMASAECMLNGTAGKLVGKEFEGFKLMAEMMNLSRLYNSIAAVSVSRRALIEAFQFLCHRPGFGRLAIEHPLIRMKLEELAAMHTANFYLVWRAIRALDLADNGDKREEALLRLLTPMIKKHTAETGVYLVRESMELMGGIGYIEDLVMPRLMRDVLVLPIWEGAGNIMSLDMLRASMKSRGLDVMCAEIETTAKTHALYGGAMLSELAELRSLHARLQTCAPEEMESSAGRFFERLTALYSKSVLMRALRSDTAAWVEPSLNYFCIRKTQTGIVPPLKTEEVKAMLGWSF